MRYRKGDVLFREGDPSDFACLILDGTVSVQRSCGNETVMLGTAETGDLVGEMGVLEAQPRSATVVATSDVSVELIDAERLVDWICATPDTARRVLGRLSRRVRSMSEQMVVLHHALYSAGVVPPTVTAEIPATSVPAASVPATVTAGRKEDTPTARKVTLRCTGAAGDAVFNIGRLPFMIGRRAPELGQSCCDEQLLVVDDSFPYRISVRHFLIDQNPRMGWLIRDLGSDLGTTVNGQFLGGIFAKDTLSLHDGLNTVVAGGIDSPFVFKVMLE